jgi:hypothetical protein
VVPATERNRYSLDSIVNCENPLEPEESCFQYLTVGVQTNGGFAVYLNQQLTPVYTSSNMPASFDSQTYATSADPATQYRTVVVNWQQFLLTRTEGEDFHLRLEVHLPINTASFVFNAYMDGECDTKSSSNITIVDAFAFHNQTSRSKRAIFNLSSDSLPER